MKELLGILLILLPFIGLFVFITVMDGWHVAVGIFLLTALVVAIVATGVHLLS